MSETYICNRCSVNQLCGRLPRGWHREGDAVVCSSCWGSSLLLRAPTLPIVEPLSGSWDELRTALKTAWAQSTAASNWAMTEFYARDVRRDQSAVKMPPMPKIYLYPEARLKFPDLPSGTLAGLLYGLQRKYKAKRYEVIWTGSASLPTMRYPQPFPVRSQDWYFDLNTQGQAILSFPLSGRRWSVRLRNGPDYRRQIGQLRAMRSLAEMAVYQDHKGHILCKLVGWVERPRSMPNKVGTLFVRTTPESFLIAVDDKDKRLWVENCDHLRRWIAEHSDRMLRLAEDQKAEQRPSPSFQQFRERAVQKQMDRVSSAIKEIAAHVANFAQRRKFATVVYDDSDKSFMGEKFPYFVLRERLKVNLDERGMEFKASGRSESETLEPLAEVIYQ